VHLANAGRGHHTPHFQTAYREHEQWMHAVCAWKRFLYVSQDRGIVSESVSPRDYFVWRDQRRDGSSLFITLVELNRKHTT
jgi:hypothetical protein